MNRRRFSQSATLAGTLSPFLFTNALGRQPATAAATPVEADRTDFGQTLAGRVGQIEPQTLLDTLRATPVTSPLFPADTPPIEPEAWDDASDTDLENALGGVVFNTGFDENENLQVAGVAIVHPDVESASAAMTATGPAPESLLGLPWFVQAVRDNAVSVIQVDYLLLAGGADASVFTSNSSSMLALRSVTHMTALLDHLDSVLTELMV